METENKSGLRRIAQGLVVAGGLAGLVATSGGCQAIGVGICEALGIEVIPNIYKGGPFIFRSGQTVTVPKEIKDEEKRYPNRESLSWEDSSEKYSAFYRDKKGLQLSCYSKNPIWYARVRDKNSDGEIDSIYVQDGYSKEIEVTPEQETMLRNLFGRLAEERVGILRSGIRIISEKPDFYPAALRTINASNGKWQIRAKFPIETKKATIFNSQYEVVKEIDMDNLEKRMNTFDGINTGIVVPSSVYGLDYFMRLEDKEGNKRDFALITTGSITLSEVLKNDIRLERVDGKLLVKCASYPEGIDIKNQEDHFYFRVYLKEEELHKRVQQGYLELDMKKLGLKEEDTYYLENWEAREMIREVRVSESGNDAYEK